MDIKSILENLIEESQVQTYNEHILSNITLSEVLALSDETNTLKINTCETDILNLDKELWTQESSNNDEGFSTYVSSTDETIKLLIDESVVEII